MRIIETGRLVPLPICDMVYGTNVNTVVHVDVLYVGESEVADGIDRTYDLAYGSEWATRG